MSRMISVLLSILISTLTAPCSGITWTKIGEQWCKRGAIFSKLALAQASCLTIGTSCHGVYEERCDGQRFFLCDEPSYFSTSDGAGCVYKSTAGPSIQGFHPMAIADLKGAVKEFLGKFPTGKCAESDSTTPTAVYSKMNEVHALEELFNDKKAVDFCSSRLEGMGLWEVCLRKWKLMADYAPTRQSDLIDNVVEHLESMNPQVGRLITGQYRFRPTVMLARIRSGEKWSPYDLATFMQRIPISQASDVAATSSPTSVGL